MGTALVALGSNLGDRNQTLQSAIEALAHLPGVAQITASRFYETAPVGGPPGQAPFLNAVARLQTTLGPCEMLAALQQLENRSGRTRAIRWSARTLDLDLLLYDQVVWNSGDLQLPHPRMVFRQFVMQPAAEIAPEMVHPTTGWTLRQLAVHLQEATPQMALTGGSAAARARLLRLLAARLPVKTVFAPRRARSVAPLAPQAVGLARRAELEFCRHCQRQLQTALADSARRLVVSDFALEEGVTLGGSWKSSQTSSSEVSQGPSSKWPLLVIAIDSPAALTEPGCDPGPTFHLRKAPLSVQLAEVLAAVEASGRLNG